MKGPLSDTMSSLMMHLLSFRPSKAITSGMEVTFVGHVDFVTCGKFIWFITHVIVDLSRSDHL